MKSDPIQFSEIEQFLPQSERIPNVVEFITSDFRYYVRKMKPLEVNSKEKDKTRMTVVDNQNPEETKICDGSLEECFIYLSRIGYGSGQIRPVAYK